MYFKKEVGKIVKYHLKKTYIGFLELIPLSNKTFCILFLDIKIEKSGIFDLQ